VLADMGMRAPKLALQASKPRWAKMMLSMSTPSKRKPPWTPQAPASQVLNAN